MKDLKTKITATDSSSSNKTSVNVKKGLPLNSEVKAGLYFSGSRNRPSNELGGRSSATSGISWY